MSSSSRAACESCGCRTCGASPAPSGDELDRREFLLAGARAAALLALAACGPISNSFTTSPRNISATLNVSDYPSLANTNGVALVSAGGAPLAVVRTGANSFEALSRICPHQGSIVNVYGAGFLCPNHGAQFNLTGHWVGGQPTGNMYSYPTSYDAASGTLTIG